LHTISRSANEPIAYINADKYIQHNLGAEDGLAGFGKLMGVLAHFRNRFFFLFAFPPERSPDGTCR
jgi:predicted SnoaL-like aldol condensation-catalyzing enzyme